MSRYEHFFAQATLATLLAFAAPALLHAESYAMTLGSGERDVTIAVGDSLNLTAGLAGIARAFQGSGTIGAPVPVHLGDHHTFTFPTAGNYSGTISDSSGAALSRITIRVVSTTLSSKAIADQVGFTRTVAVTVAPAGAPITFAASNPSLLTVSQQVITGTAATFNVKALSRGSPVVIAQITTPGGLRTIASRPIDEFTLETGALADTVIDNELGIGFTHLTMRPFIPNLQFDFSMFAHRSTFHGGATAFSAFTSRDFTVSRDPATNENIGTYRLEIDMPADESSYCFSFRPFQDDPVPIGDSGNVNGHGCKVDVDTLILCVNTVQPLVMHAVVTNTGKHPVRILRKAGATAPGVNALFTAPDTAPDGATWGKQFDCSLSTPQKANNVKAGDHCEKYDVEIDDTRFNDRVQVTDELTLDLLASGPIPSGNEYDKFLRFTILLGRPPGDGLGPIPTTPVVGSSGAPQITNASVVVGTICPPVNPSDVWAFKRDVQSKLFLFRPTDLSPVEGPGGQDPAGGRLGPPLNNDGPLGDFVDATPSPTNRIYSGDVPGFEDLGALRLPVGSILAFRLNANEWVLKNGVLNDCTPILPWYARVTIRLSAAGWVRVGLNDSGIGHKPLAFPDGEAFSDR